MKTNWLQLGILAGAMALVGCDGDDTSAPTADAGTSDTGTGGDTGTADDGATPDMTPPPTDLPLALLLPRMAEILCDKRDCLVGGDAALLRALIVVDGDDCEERTESFLRAEYGTTVMALANGDIVYDAVAALACTNALAESDSCNLFGNNCVEDLFAGQIAEAGECNQWTPYCASGLVCQGEHGLPYQCPGECVEAVAKGEDCSDNPCAPPARVDGAFAYAQCTPQGEGPPVCIHMVNTNDGTAGDPCDQDAPAVDFVITRDGCAEGFDCQGEPGSRTCVARPTAALGEACEGDEDEDRKECPAGAVCAGTCRTLTFATTVGAACGFTGTDAATLCDPFEGVVCDINLDTWTGTCVAVGDGTEGAVCSGFGAVTGTGTCNTGLFCPNILDGAPFAAECAPKKADGAECEQDDECLAGSCDQSGFGGLCGAPDCSPPT